MTQLETQRYPFTDTGDVDEALNRYKEIYAGLADMALDDFNDANDPSGAFRYCVKESMVQVENTGTNTSDKMSAVFAILQQTFHLCENVLANRGLSMESRTVFETMAFTYSAACNYGW